MSFLLINIYGSFVINTCKLKILLEGLERYEDTTLQNQKAQLSQRDCALLRIIEYFAKSLKPSRSLKVIRNNTPE